MSRFGTAALVLAAFLLHACASTAPKVEPVKPSPVRPETSAPRPPRPAPSPAEPEPTPIISPPAPPLVETTSPARLPGWDKEDHLAALHAYQQGCGAAPKPADKRACAAARAIAVDDQDIARRFFENNFTVQAWTDPGLLTAYFAPIYEARDMPDGEFRAAVRPVPPDLVPGKTYATRAVIEARPPNGVLTWMRPEDLFFLQIQGSGTLVYPDGRRMRAAYAAHNSQTFKSVANYMRDKGLLAGGNTSGDAIHAWLAAHRGEEANAVMQFNPRYVFFSLSVDDGSEPPGAAGIPLPPGHAIAVDPAEHAMGELIWIDAAAPILNGAFPVYQRLVLALDTGGAIKGKIRADLYLGRGDAAGAEAGRVRHSLRMYRLVAIEGGGR